MARWLIAVLVVTIYFATIEHRVLCRPATQVAGSVRLVHWNITQQPYRPYVDQLVNEMIALDGDITVLTNPGYAPWQPPVVEALGAGTPPVGMGSLSIISRFPVLQPEILFTADAYELLHEARPDSSKSADAPQQTNLSTMISIVSVEIDTSAQIGQRLKMYMIDMPSDPRIPRMRLAQAIRAQLDDSHIARRFGAPDIIVGDFNIPRGSASVATLFPGMREAFETAGHGYGASFHRKVPMWHIDHLLLGPTVDCLRYDLVDPHLSRHDAQVAWIKALSPHS
jgi:hypothetical protein